MLFRAPEIKIGLENDITCGLIYVQNMPEMDMIIYVSHNQDSVGN